MASRMPEMKGITRTRRDDPVRMLVQLMQKKDRGASVERLRGIIDELKDIAEQDPRIAPRVVEAIEALRGAPSEESGSDDRDDYTSGSRLAKLISTPV